MDARFYYDPDHPEKYKMGTVAHPAPVHTRFEDADYEQFGNPPKAWRQTDEPLFVMYQRIRREV